MAEVAPRLRPSAPVAPIEAPSATTASLRIGPGPREDLIWFAAVSIVGLLGSLWYLYVVEIYAGDAVSRAVLAHNIILSRDPHLAAIGFIWSPLQSMVELPFMALLVPFKQTIFAAQITSVLFSAGLAVVLNRFFGVWISSWRWRGALTLAVMSNPLIASAVLNGMTENIFLFFAVAAALYLTTWRPGELTGLMAGAVFCALGFFVRYEALAYLAAGLAAVAVMTTSRAVSREVMEAYFTAFIAPFAFVVMLWLLWNFLFVGDPLYFLHAIGSNEQQTAGIREGGGGDLSLAYNSIVGTVRYAGRQLLFVYPVYIPLMAVGLYAAVHRRSRPLTVLLLFATAAPAFEVFQIFRGQLFTWVRYWVYLPAFAAVVGVFASNLLFETNRARRRAYAAIIAVCLVSSVPTVYAMNYHEAATDEQAVARIVLGTDPSRFVTPQDIDPTLRDFRVIAPSLDRLMDENPEATLMIDSYAYGPLVLLVNNPDRFVIASDRDFKQRIEDAHHQVDYILLAPPVGQAALTGANAYYPEMYGGGIPWARLVTEYTENGKGRLFRIDHNVPN